MQEQGPRGLTVAVTGPTGDIGTALVRALDRLPGIDRVVGMARRPFDPGEHGLERVEYVQGDILDRTSVDTLVKDADVVVHLAFLIFGSREQTRKINLEGSRNVFEAALQAPATRLVYTSSVAAYGFHQDNPEMLTEEVPARGTRGNYYSEQKAELESLLDAMAARAPTDVYVFRPCIVAGPRALSLIEQIPYIKMRDKLPDRIGKTLGALPLLRPVIPDPGLPFQLVHEDDVAQALCAAILGRGKPGAYNLAGDGTIGLSDLAHALGWYAVPVPDVALDVTAEVVSRLPYLPLVARWIDAVRVPVLMDCTKAHRELGWEPRYDTVATLADTVAGAREQGLLARPRSGR